MNIRYSPLHYLRVNPFPQRVVNGVEYGRATSGTKGAAAEEAARQAVVALRGY